MTVESTIDYEGLAQEAMRGVVRKVLANTAKSGLAGDHHFYISFDTEAPGSSLSKRLKEKYPREMTIVLQHRFWDLIVSEDRFEVKLTFDGIPERLVVPFASIKVFFDPSVRFGLQFEEPGAGAEGRREPAAGTFENLTARTGRPARKPRGTRKPQVVKDADAGGRSTEAEEAHDEQHSRTPHDAQQSSDASEGTAAEEAASQSSNDAVAPVKPGGAEIVSLDKFRKK